MNIDFDLIDDTQQENDSYDFHRFYNQTTDTFKVMEQIQREEEAASELLEPNNYLRQDEIENMANEVYDETDNFLKSKDKFLESLINPIIEQTEDNFYLTLLHNIRFVKSNKVDLSVEEDIEKEIGFDLNSKIKAIKDICNLDLNCDTFEEMCYQVNNILLNEKMFLRIYEIKDNFRYLFHENKDTKKCLRSLSSCIKEKFNGFTWAELKLSKSQKTDILPINVLYKPIRKVNEFIKCYFVKDFKICV